LFWYRPTAASAGDLGTRGHVEPCEVEERRGRSLQEEFHVGSHPSRICDDFSADEMTGLCSFLPIFLDVNFESFALTRNGFTIGLSVRAPPKARSRKSEYWDSKAGLSKGHLVAVVWHAQVFVGTVASSKPTRIF
jgi:hypothetical protein